MKTKRLSIQLLFLLFLIQGCKQADDLVFDLEQEILIPIFEEDTTYYSNQIILNAIVAKNEIYLINHTTFSNFTADSEREISSPIHHTSLSYFKKHCLSKNYMALTASIFDDKYIKFITTSEVNFFQEQLSFSVSQVESMSGDSTLDYSKFNTSPFDNTAINEFDKAVLPMIKKTDSTAIVFILFDLRELVGSANPFNPNVEYNPLFNLPKEQYTEIIFPQESTTEINRIESFRQNFYVSTAEHTYVIRPDGSFKLVTESSAADFFEYDGKIYADFGNRIAFTADDGETWEEINNTSTFSGFREFQEVYGHLVFFFEDDLYLVNPDDFSFSMLNNEGLTGSKITAVMPFFQRVYVATLSGLFHKPIEALAL